MLYDSWSTTNMNNALGHEQGDRPPATGGPPTDAHTGSG